MESLVCVCGAGTMGRGITLAAASQGISVILYDLSPDMLTAASSAIEQELDQAVEKKRIQKKERENTLQRIVFQSQITACKAPLIIEAIAEKAEAKSTLFKALALVNSGDTIFTSNTSSLSITEIAEQTGFAERVAGLHFFNPAQRMKLVEIVRTKYIKDPVIEQLHSFVMQLKKTPVICRDTPGFIVNRVARPFYLEALRLAELKAADITTIDNLMESVGFPMGPFHLMDLIGQDINYAVSCSVFEALGKPPRLKPFIRQEELVKQGLLGKKTGRGFFQYAKG